MSQRYENLIRDFAQHVGLDGETLLQTQEVVIEGLKVGLDFEGDETLGDVVYFTLLGVPQPLRKSQVYETLLEANHLWVGTGGATLGVQQGTGQVIFCGRIDVEGVTAESLSLLLDAFVDNALFWHGYINDESPSEGWQPPGQFMIRG